MNLDKFLVISGVPGVHKLVASRPNGLIIEDRQEKRTRFVPVRQQQITPLGTVSIYTETEDGSVPLVDVFQKMLDNQEEIPPVSLDSPSPVLREYFTKILPEHDADRVHIHDIKKCIKWFNFMLEKGIFEEARLEAEQAKAETAESETITENAETIDQPESLSQSEADAAEPASEIREDVNGDNN